MVVYKIEDSGPTTTITFAAFTAVEGALSPEDFTPFAYPENEGTEIIFLGGYLDSRTCLFELKDDAGWPGSGESAAEKRDNLVTLLKSGGDNDDWKFKLTFTEEDGTDVVKWGKVGSLTWASAGGDNISLIEGEFEFIQDDIS